MLDLGRAGDLSTAHCDGEVCSTAMAIVEPRGIGRVNPVDTGLFRLRSIEGASGDADDLHPDAADQVGQHAKKQQGDDHQHAVARHHAQP